MSVEQEIRANEVSKQTERLLPGNKLLLAGLGSLLAFSFTKEKSPLSKVEVDEELMRSIFTEWHSIHDLFTKLVGRDNIVVSKTNIVVGKHNDDSSVNWKAIDLPEGLNFGAVTIPFLSRFYLCWPRDAYSMLNGNVFANPHAWNTPPENVRPSGLGEQGKVLIKNKSVLVTPDVWKDSRDEIRELTQNGFKIGCLPLVDASRQRHELMESHIDGHSVLIEDKHSELILLVADSYSRQGRGTRKLIRQAADKIEARMVEVDDSNLPPLALNLIQLEDGSIACTNAQARDLYLTLSTLVGSDKVFETQIPLVEIPKRSSGSMRCLTNILPPVFDNLLVEN